MRKSLALGASVALAAGTAVVGGIVLATSASAATPGTLCNIVIDGGNPLLGNIIYLNYEGTVDQANHCVPNSPIPGVETGVNILGLPCGSAADLQTNVPLLAVYCPD